MQIVTAIVDKSDTYAELPWKAFALGVSIAAFTIVVVDLWRPQWPASYVAVVHSVTTLAAGAAAALVAIFVPPFARLLLRASRCEVEVRQYAQSLFLKHAIFETRARNAVLILISLFERRVEILTDAGLGDRVTESEWRGMIARMTPHLRDTRPFDALTRGVDAVGDLLASKGFHHRAGNELPNRPIEEHGA